MTEISKQAQPAQETKPETRKMVEGALDEKQLDTVTGGTKSVDKASPVLMQSCATGVHIKEATLTH
jgi:type VI protein secretion system component Hcp